MKKLIITIVAMATIALAANKPVCRETDETPWTVEFTCNNPTKGVKRVHVIVWKYASSFFLYKAMRDGSSESMHVSFDEDKNVTHVRESTKDDIGVENWSLDRDIEGDRFSFYYNQLRDEYDLRRN